MRQAKDLQKERSSEGVYELTTAVSFASLRSREGYQAQIQFIEFLQDVDVARLINIVNCFSLSQHSSI